MMQDPMPQRSVEVKPGEYAAYVYAYDSNHNIIGGDWVNVTRVYRNGKGRHSIEYVNVGSQKIHTHNHPGASSFELYKRVP